MRCRYYSPRQFVLGLTVALLCGLTTTIQATPLEGHYLEARTCQVYTGPCFANGEIGPTGKDAVMAWNIQHGDRDGIDLTGLSVALVVRASHTLGHQGFANAKLIRSMIVVDQRANSAQRTKLIEFVRSQAALATQQVVSVTTAPISLRLDIDALTGNLEIDDLVTLKTRQARPGDCICSNESAYYPPLSQLAGAVPSVTLTGDVTAWSLGTKWSIPDSRTSYLGTFNVQ